MIWYEVLEDAERQARAAHRRGKGRSRSAARRRARRSAPEWVNAATPRWVEVRVSRELTDYFRHLEALAENDRAFRAFLSTLQALPQPTRAAARIREEVIREPVQLAKPRERGRAAGRIRRALGRRGCAPPGASVSASGPSSTERWMTAPEGRRRTAHARGP